MLVLNEAETRAATPFRGLIEAIRSMFRSGCVMPQRHHHDVEVPGETDATLLLMPAWVPGGHIGVKMVSVFPGNAQRGLPAIFGSYLLSSGRTGQLLAVLDGAELTARRTAAASALAADYLARKDASTMLMVGTGRLSENVIEAHALIRPLTRVMIWGRDPKKAELVAHRVARLGLQAEVAGNLGEAASQADIISCATLSTEPLIHGEWLKPGSHLDLIGAFKPSMRESDDTAVKRASIYVDTREGATSEAGDIVQPLRAGIISLTDIRADLAELCKASHSGRGTADEITLFKSVGAASEDLAAAIFAVAHVKALPGNEG
jgi:ornithine cyclodeaminase